MVEEHSELDSLLNQLPLLPCVHCGKLGNLTGHGLLRGYAEQSSERVTRGRRILCSNRGRKSGCGRTVSTLLTRFVECCSLTAVTLWALFCGLADGLSVARTAQSADFPQTLRSAYRKAVRLKKEALNWRSWLTIHRPTPPSRSMCPLQQLRVHLEHALGPKPFVRAKFRAEAQLI